MAPRTDKHMDKAILDSGDVSVFVRSSVETCLESTQLVSLMANVPASLALVVGLRYFHICLASLGHEL